MCVLITITTCWDHYQVCLKFYININRRGCVEVERSLGVREFGVRSPVAKDISRKKQVVTTPLPNARQ